MGTTIAVGDVTADDDLRFVVSGTPYLQGPGLYGVNAAGIRTVEGTYAPLGGSWQNPFSGFTYGAMIVTLNGTDSVQVFTSSASNGLGQAAVPLSLAFSGKLGDLFAITGTLRSATINFRVDDSGYRDNSGEFVIDAVAVPEPATWLTMFVGFFSVGIGLRRRPRQLGATVNS